MTATERGAFTPVAILIPADAVWEDSEGEHVDPAKVTPLHLDSHDNTGYLFTKEEWESGIDYPRLYRDYGGRHEGLEDGERVELLPDMVIVKLEERDYWVDPFILANTTAIYGVYAVDRRKHVHICSITPNYEAYRLDTQFDGPEMEDDGERERLYDAIREGAMLDEPFSYFEVRDIDRVLKNECRPGCTPANGKSGGYVVTGLASVTTEDCYLELREAQCNGDF